jgi:hypothetical protein
MKNITRRAALAVTGAVSAAVLAADVVPAAEIAAEPEHPWERANRLAGELSAALAEGDGAFTGPGGKWNAIVFPAGHSNYPIGFGNIEAREWPSRNVTNQCRQVMEGHRKAREALNNACGGIDRRALGREPSKAAWRRWRRAERAEESALVAVCAFQAYGDANARAKAAYLMPFVQSGELFERNITALVNSMVLS